MEDLVVTSFWKDKRVLITGHTGFKGSWMSLWLHQMGADVYGYSLEPDHEPSLFSQLELGQKINHQVGDICDSEKLARCISDCKADFIFHLAAQSLVLKGYKQTLETWNTNVMGTAHLLETLRSVDHACTVVVVTTDKVYQNNEWEYGYRETDRLGGVDPYSASKAGTELVVQSYRSLFTQEDKSISVASARAGNVIGGGDWCENRLLPDIASALMQGNSVETRNPNAVRPWQHVLEPLSGYMCLAKKMSEEAGFTTAFNFGPDAGDNRTVEDVIQAALKTWPGIYHSNIDNSAPHEAGLLKLTIDKARSQLGWEPKWGFDVAVAKTMEWYKLVHEGNSPLSITLNHIADYEAT